MVILPSVNQRFIYRSVAYSGVIFLLIISFIYGLWQNTASAAPFIDWSASGPVTVNSSYTFTPSYLVGQPDCTHTTIDIRSKFAGIISKSRLGACVTNGRNLSLAHTPQGVYIAFKSDRYFYQLQTDSAGVLTDQVVLVPGGDRIGLLMGAGTYRWVRVYDDVGARLNLNSDTLRYQITNWEDSIFASGDTSSTSGVTINLSSNGRFAVYQMRDAYPGTYPGIVRVDLETGEQRKFGVMWYSNYASPFPNPHYTISNDGNTVVGGGIGHLSAWSLSEGCLVEPDAYVNNSPCPFRVIGDTDYGEEWDPQSLSRTYSLALNDDASELSFIYLRPGGEEFKKISVSPAGYVASISKLDYLALGDSYSSGEGDTEKDKRTGQKYYRPWTDIEEDAAWGQPREKCHISTRSYPYILAQGMGLGDAKSNSSTRWQTIACSGARTYDVNDNDTELYLGQKKGGGLTLISNGEIPRLQGYDVNTLKAIALDEFIPGREMQIEFVKEYKPRVITLTMGGNDVGFAKKLKACANPFTIQWTCRYATEGGRSDLVQEIRGQYTKLKSLYEKLYIASGKQAKIYVLGYPQFINGDKFASCEGRNIGALDGYEREMTYNAVELMNNVIEQAARAAGANYIDIEDSLRGGRLCDTGQMYMTGVTGLAGWRDNQEQESFHPNAKGNYQIAMTIWEQVDHESLLEYDVCLGILGNNCPDDTATEESIIIPPYFQALEPGYEVEYISDMTSELAIKGEFVTVARTSYSFSPGSVVEFTLFSDPVSLGGHLVNSDGSLDIDLEIPNSVPVGYHTLVADGFTYSGEPIRYEQIILVRGQNPDDIDDNGVLDTEQPCGPFLEASGIDSDLDGIDDACDPQIAKEPELYRWRLGHSGRTYGDGSEAEDQVYIERNIWAGSATGVTGDEDLDGDGWTVVGVSQADQLVGVDITDIENVTNFDVLGDGTESSQFYPVLYLYPNSPQCRAYKPANLSRVTAEEKRELTMADISNDRCPQDLPDDNLPQEPAPNPPIKENILSKLTTTLKVMKTQVANIVQAIITVVVIGMQILKAVLL